MVARKDYEADFISGIYNYCDRWCERCPMTHRCFLFYQESKQREQTLEEGKDPDDFEVVVENIEQNFSEAKQLLQQTAEEQGIDLQKLAPAEEPQMRRTLLLEQPIHKKAHKFAMDCHRFLDELCSYIHEEEQKGSPSEAIAVLQDCFEILGWYHMQTAVKIDRALSGKLGVRQRISRVTKLDSAGSAKVAYLGLLRCLDSLTRVYENNQPMASQLMPLLHTLYELIDDVDREFPGHKRFKRPGFDD
ncbi:MAG TPA: hypothetical protein VI958_03155 [Acidobacteriota bacterium]